MVDERCNTAPLLPREARRGGVGGGGQRTESQSQRKADERVPRARALRRETSTPERKLWQSLRALPVDGTHFRRQATIGKYFADFACHSTRLIIEIDGDGHAQEDQRAGDLTRTAYLESQGYRVVRFWNHDVMRNIDGVMEIISAAIGDACGNRPPPPTPPRRASRGGRGEKRLP